MKQILRLGERYGLSVIKRYIGCVLLIVIGVAWLTKTARAQDTSKTVPANSAANQAIDLTTTGIQIGQEVPDVTINNIHNYKTSTAKLSDFQGKLLILDFWATWCSPCIAMIPRMDSLQKAFGDKVQFLSVTYQPDTLAMPFMVNYEKLKGTRFGLPIITSDTILHQLFPHKTLPHYVWIGPDGVAKAITELDEVTGPSINAALKGNFAISQKRDFTVDYDRTKPFLINGNGGDGESLIYHSVLSGYIKGISGSINIQKVEPGKSRKITLANIGLITLFSAAYRKEGYFGNNRIFLNVRDSSKFIWNEKGRLTYPQWLQQGNGYCYELIVPPFQSRQAFSMMQEDIRNNFPQYNVSVREREMNCYALVQHGPAKKSIVSQGGKPAIVADRFSCKLKNSYLASWIFQLNVLYLQNTPWPLMDDTGITSAVDLNLNCGLNDLSLLNTELAKYGLQFIKAVRKMKVLSIEDQIQR